MIPPGPPRAATANLDAALQEQVAAQKAAAAQKLLDDYCLRMISENCSNLRHIDTVSIASMGLTFTIFVPLVFLPILQAPDLCAIKIMPNLLVIFCLSLPLWLVGFYLNLRHFRAIKSISFLQRKMSLAHELDYKIFIVASLGFGDKSLDVGDEEHSKQISFARLAEFVGEDITLDFSVLNDHKYDICVALGHSLASPAR